MSNQKSKPILDMLKSLLVLYQNKEYVNAENLALSIIKKYQMLISMLGKYLQVSLSKQIEFQIHKKQIKRH